MSRTTNTQPDRSPQIGTLRWMAVSHVNQKQMSCCQLDAADHTTLNIPVYSEMHFLDALGRVCLPFKSIALAS